MRAKRVIIIISVVLVLALTAMAIYMLWPTPREEENFFAKYYDDKVAEFEEENKSLSSVDIAFIGDSITDGYEPYGNAYSEYKVAWRGIGGDTTTGLLARLNVSLYEVNPKVIVLLIGINNIDTMFENYEQIIAEITENLPQAKLVVQSLHPTSQGLAYRNDLIKESNTKIVGLAEKYGFTYVDVNTALTDPATGEYSSEYTEDGLHPNAEGYEKITEILLPVIKTKLAE